MRAVGADAEQAAKKDLANVELIWPFDHPRSLLADFQVAEKLLQHALHILHAGRWLRAKPVVLVHPLELLEGGLTSIERRAFKELAVAAGAGKALVWQGRELLDDEVGKENYTVAA